MPVLVNIHHLEKHPLRLTGEVSPAELDIQSRDELIRFPNPVRYDLEVQKLERAILAQGAVSVDIECDCARCLKTFSRSIGLGHWAEHLPLVGEESVAVENDCVDLTPYLREDILLALPQHPLCSQECRGLLREYERGGKFSTDKGLSETKASPWDDLDKLNL